MSIGVGTDGRIIDAQAYRQALIRELGAETAHAMLSRLPQSVREPVTLDHDSPPDTTE